MFIYVMYKDPPELSTFRRMSTDEDLAEEKSLLVNPNCTIRVMLEYIRKQCKLALNTQFDLCDEGGIPKALFSYPTYAYITQQFEHKKVYYLIVIYKQMVTESEKTFEKVFVFPQVNRENRLYLDLQNKVRRILTGEPDVVTPATGKNTPAPKKK